MLDTIRSKVEPAGLVHKFFGEQVPDGFFWVLLKAQQNSTWTRYANAPTDEWFSEQWQGTILGDKTQVIEPSPKGTPARSAKFICYDGSIKNKYKLTLKCFETLEEAKEFVKKGDFSEKVKYNWSWNPDGTSGVAFVKKSKKTQGVTFDSTWYNETNKVNIKSFDFKVRTNHFNEPTEEQRIAQRQVDLNSARITKLEKELKDLRELQKLLKGMR
jgi:hypothetical protein